MSEGEPLQNPTQEAKGNPGEPEVEPTAVANEANSRRQRSSTDPPIIKPWNSDSDDVPAKARENIFIGSDNGGPPKSHATTRPTPLTDAVRGRSVVNNDLYHEPFIFKESDKDVRDLVASPFTTRIRDYDMPDDIKVPTNLRTYDGTTDPDDHLTVFMGTMDVHKLPKPAWCKFFHITLCGVVRFWYNNLTPESIVGFHQLRDKFRFSKETLHMVDRSDVMVSGAFISSLCPGRLFKDLIAKPPTSLEDLFTQTNNFIRVEDANNENRLREPRRETKQHVTRKEDNATAYNPASRIRRTSIMAVEANHFAITLHDYRSHISKTVMVDFMIVRAPSPYNIILGRPGMMQLGAVASTLHALVKFQTQADIAIIKGEKFHPSVCNHISQKRCQQERAKGTKDVEHVVINDAHSDQTITIAASLPKILKEKLCELLRSNKDVFAWTPADMTGIPRELAEHKLNIHPRSFLVWQKKRAIAKERSEAITTKVSKLVEARILKQYSSLNGYPTQ
ncbi:hypothetical protein Tco_0173880 [Tanacetum coccineum]